MRILKTLKASFSIVTLAVLLYMIAVQFYRQFFEKTFLPFRNQKPNIQDNEPYNQSIHHSSFSHNEDRSGNSTKTLFIIQPPHWFIHWIGKKWDTQDLFSSCPVQNCLLTRNKTSMNIADAVLFRIFSEYKHGDLDKCIPKKKPGQVWIVFEFESPTVLGPYTKLDKQCHRNMFNWTITYRRDSDFTFAHGEFSKVSSGYNESAADMIFKAKKKTAVGFISHCPIQSRRKDYIEKLRKYGIDIDIYGTCGNLQCKSGLKRSDELKTAWDLKPVKGMKRDCFAVLDSTYKFYLSFENSLCDDYITEKSLHRVLRHNIIPIIRDACNRSLFHPPNSYLDTKEFRDIKSLADRIKTLNNNLEEYKKYFHWKNNYSIETSGGVLQTILCNICERLHNPRKYQRIYNNVIEFLFSRNKDSPICHEPNDIH